MKEYIPRMKSIGRRKQKADVVVGRMVVPLSAIATQAKQSKTKQTKAKQSKTNLLTLPYLT